MLTPYLWSQKLRAAGAGQSLAQGARVRWQLQATNWPCQYWDWWNLQCQIKTWTTKKYSHHVYCIFLYHISHITYQKYMGSDQPKHWDITHLHCELWWFRWRWRPQFHDPDGTDGPRGVGVPLCPGLLTSSWAATIHQDRASRTRAATGARVGYLNWYNAAVDDVRCTCTEGFTYLCHIFQ